MAVVWQTATGDETMSITGSSFTGTQPTSPTLTLTLTVRNGTVPVVLTSSTGDCTVTIDQALPTTFAGSFMCARLAETSPTGELAVNLTGTFSASG